MTRELGLKIALGVVGVMFVLVAYPMVLFMRADPALSMMLCVYVTLGVFLLLAIRNPAEHRSLIAFAAWSSLVHALWMGMQALRGMVMRGELIGCGVLGMIWIALLALTPRADARIDA